MDLADQTKRGRSRQVTRARIVCALRLALSVSLASGAAAPHGFAQAVEAGRAPGRNEAFSKDAPALELADAPSAALDAALNAARATALNTAQATALNAARATAQGTAAAGVQASTSPESAKQPLAPGRITGTVLDAEANVMNDADVSLLRDGGGTPQRTKTDSDGRFSFSSVSPGRFRVQASAPGMTAAFFAGTLAPGESYLVPSLQLKVAAVNMDVSVVASQQDLAAAELKVEERQRLAGFLPNFFVSYDWKAPPLTTKQKFSLAFKNASDPGNIVVAGAVAGVEQAQDTFAGYGQGVEGYSKRFGAAMGDLVTGTMLGGAIYPTLFRQDPRYFYKGTGSIKSRALYAITRPLICRGDNGKNQPAFASVLGDLSAGAVTNLYYPPEDRHGAALTFEEGLLNIAGDALNDVMQEFVLRHLTPHAPGYASTATLPNERP